MRTFDIEHYIRTYTNKQEKYSTIDLEANYRMFIKLTNASPQLRGNTLLIQTDNIVSIHDGMVQREGSDQLERSTFIFVPPHGTWEVMESPEQVFDMLCQKI